MANWFEQNAPPSTAATPPPTGNWFEQNAPPAGDTPQVTSTVNYPTLAERFGGELREVSGVNPIMDVLRAANFRGTPEEVAARGERGKQAAQALIQGIADEPRRVWGELSGVGESLVDFSKPMSDLVSHMAGTVPGVGPILQRYLAHSWAQKYPEAAADLTALATLHYAPKALGAAAPTLEKAGAAIPGALKGGLKGAVEPVAIPYRHLPIKIPLPASVSGAITGKFAGHYLAGDVGGTVGMIAGAGAPIIRGAIRGARTALDARAAAEAAARPPGVTTLAPDYFTPQVIPPSRQLPPGTPGIPAAADASFVRAVPAQYAQPEPLPPSRQLPPGRDIRQMPPAEDTSFVRAVPGEYPPVEPAAAPPAPPPEVVTLDELSQSLVKKPFAKASGAEKTLIRDIHQRANALPAVSNEPPVAAPIQANISATAADVAAQPAPAPAAETPPTTPEAAFMQDVPAAARTPESYRLAQQLRDAMEGKPAAETFAEKARGEKVDAITDYIIRNKIPGSMLDQFGAKEWKLVSDQAGVKTPSAETQAAVRARIAEYEGAAEMPADIARKPIAEAKAAFEMRRASRRRTPPER